MSRLFRFATLIVLFAFATPSVSVAEAVPPMRKLEPSIEALREDLVLILAKAHLAGRIEIEVTSTPKASDSFSGTPLNVARVTCANDKMKVSVRAGEDAGQTIYLALRKAGFLFPHPRMQISPSWKQASRVCGRSFEWKPVLRYAGFHFHTLHANEWVQGFLAGDEEIAFDTVRWLARNQQNVFDLSLLDFDSELLFSRLKKPFALAKSLGIHTGVAFGLAFGQQSSFKLIDWIATFFDGWSVRQLKTGLEAVLAGVDVSFINVEMGTTEFTSTNFDRTLLWLNEAGELASRRGVVLMTKIHVSSGQHDEKWGNYNFLPHHANTSVGILPHTVYLYALEAPKAPMYGNENFAELRGFMLAEKDKRRTWFYPETSYFCSLDIDVPLFLTDYLVTRARDFAFLDKHGVEGQLNFTTGQELGYWLFDWTTTLLNDRDNAFDPYVGLKLLGEDVASWKKIVEFQSRELVERDVLGSITGAELGTELFASIHQTLRKSVLKQLRADPAKLEKEIVNLEAALTAIPQDVRIKNVELDRVWRITKLRIAHALEVRRALAVIDEGIAVRGVHLKKAEDLRNEAQLEMNALMKENSRYPTARLFERNENLTSYPYGYAYSSSNLHYWKREEGMVANDDYNPFFMSLLSAWDAISGQVL